MTYDQVSDNEVTFWHVINLAIYVTYCRAPVGSCVLEKHRHSVCMSVYLFTKTQSLKTIELVVEPDPEPYE